MASTHARSGAFSKDESDNDYEHSHADTSDSNEEFASASEGDDDLPWEPIITRSPAISRASPIVPSQTPTVPLASPEDIQKQQHHHRQQEARVYSHQSQSANTHRQENQHRQEHHTSRSHVNQSSGSSSGGHTFSSQSHYHTQNQSYHQSSSSSSLSQLSPSQTISRGTPKLRERMRQSPVPYSKIVQAYLDPTTQLQSPEHVRIAWLQDQQETRQDSSDDDEDTHESKTHTLQIHTTTYQTRTQSQIRPQPVPIREDLHSSDVSKAYHSSASITSQSVHAIAPHHNPQVSSHLTTRTNTTDTIPTTDKKLSSIDVPVESEEGESGWGFDDEEIREEITQNKLEAYTESAEDIKGHQLTEINHPGLEERTAVSINLDEASIDDPDASWGFDVDTSFPVESHLSSLAQDAIVPQEDTYPHIHNIHESDGADDGWGYDDQGIEIAESAIQSELAVNAQEHTYATHTWNDTAGQSISVVEEEEDAWGNNLQEVNVTGVPEDDVQVPVLPRVPTSASATFSLAQTVLEVEEEDAWDDGSQNIDIELDSYLDIRTEAPQEEMPEKTYAQDNDLDITTEDMSPNEHLDSLPAGKAQNSHQLEVKQRLSSTSEGAIDETSWGFGTDGIPNTPLHEHVQHSNEEKHQHSNLSMQDGSNYPQADGSPLMQQEHAAVSTRVTEIHFDNHTVMDSKGQADLVVSSIDDIENTDDAWGYDDPIVETHEPIVERTENAPADPVSLESIHEIVQSSIEEEVYREHRHDTRDHINNGSDNEHDNEVRQVLLAVKNGSFVDKNDSESSLSTGPMSSRSSHHLDSVDQDVPTEQHIHLESDIYRNSPLGDAVVEHHSEVKDSADSDTGSDIYNDLSTARAGLNASSNRLNEILDDDDYLEHMERGVPMNRSISTPYSDDESPPKFIVEDELVELMERGERPLPGQVLTHSSEDSEESEEVDSQAYPIEHGIDGSNMTTSFGAELESATEDSSEVTVASETITTKSTAILDTTPTSSTELEPVETAHSVGSIVILGDTPDLRSSEKAEEHVTTDLLDNVALLEEVQPGLEEALEETKDSHEEQTIEVLHDDLAPFDFQHKLGHLNSLDVTIHEDDAWMDQDIQIAVDTTPRDTQAVATESDSDFAALKGEISHVGASNELRGEVHVQECQDSTVVQEQLEQARPSSLKVGSIVKYSEPEQGGDIVEDAWGWDEQEVEVNLEIQKETPSVQSEEQSSGERSPTPDSNDVHGNEFDSEATEALFDKSHEGLLFSSVDIHASSENTSSAPIDSQPFGGDDTFKDLETTTVILSESTGVSRLIEDVFGQSTDVQETLQVDEDAPLEPQLSTQELVLPETHIASTFKALEPEAEDQDFEDSGGAWDDESAWPDISPKDVGDNKLSGKKQHGLENPATMDMPDDLGQTRQDRGSEIETNMATSILDDPKEDFSVQEADQWVDPVATVETTELVLDHVHFRNKDIEFQAPHNEYVRKEHVAITDPWDEDIDTEGTPIFVAETGPSHTADLTKVPIPFLGANHPVSNDMEGEAWMENIEGLSKVSDISTAKMEDQPPVSSSTLLSALDDITDDKAQGWVFDEDLAEEPLQDFKELVNSGLNVPGASAPVANAMSPHDRLFSDDIHHLSTVASKLESPLSSPVPAFESISKNTTNSSIVHHVHTEDRTEEEEQDAWDNDVNILEDTTVPHVDDTVETEEDEKDAWGDSVDGATLKGLAESQELATHVPQEDSWDNDNAGLETLGEELKVNVESQKAEAAKPEIAQVHEDISACSKHVHEATPEADSLIAGNIHVSTEAIDDGWGFDMEYAPQKPSSTWLLEHADRSTPTPLDPVALPKTQEHHEAGSPVTTQKEQQVATAEHSEEEDGLSPWQDVSPQSVSKRSDATVSLGSEFESEYSIRSMDDEERTSPAHIHERNIDSLSSASGHLTTKISATMSWTDLNDDEWQDEDTNITQELRHVAETKTASVKITSNCASNNAIKLPSVEVQELPDLSGADSWDFDQEVLENGTSSAYMDETLLASKFDMSRHTKTPDTSERGVLQHKISSTSVTTSPGRTFSPYQSSNTDLAPLSPTHSAVGPSTSSSSLSGNVTANPTAEVEDDSHLPLAIRQQRARLAARGKPLPPISKYKSTKDQTMDKPAPSGALALSPRLSGATSPVISFTSPVGAKSPVISAATVSSDQKYLSPALQKQRERLEKKRAATAAATASAPLSAARRLTVGELSEQAVKPPSPLIAKAMLPSAVSPTVVKKVETTTTAFEYLSSSASSPGLSSSLMDASSPVPVEEYFRHQSPQQYESPVLSSRAHRSSNTPTSPLQRSNFSVTSPTPPSPLADGFVRRSRDGHRPAVASGLDPQDTDMVKTSQSEVHRHASRSSVSKTVLSSGWDNVTEDEEVPVVEEKASGFSGTSFLKSSTIGSSGRKEPESVSDRSSPLMSSSSTSGFYQQSVPGLDRDHDNDEVVGSKPAFGVHTASGEDPYGQASARSRKAKSSFEGSSSDYKEDPEEGTLIGSTLSASVSLTSPTGAKSINHRHDHHSSSNNNNRYLGGSNSLLGDITSIMDEKKKYGGAQNSSNHKSDDHDSDKKKAVASNTLGSGSANVPKSSSWSFGSWVSSAVAVATESIDKAYETLDPEYSRMKARGGGSPLSSEGGLDDLYNKKPGYVVGGSSLALGLASISTTGSAAMGGPSSGKSSVSVERASSDFAVSGSGSDAHAQHISHGHGYGQSHGHGYGSPQQASPRLTRKNVGDSR